MRSPVPIVPSCQYLKSPILADRLGTSTWLPSFDAGLELVQYHRFCSYGIFVKQASAFDFHVPA